MTKGEISAFIDTISPTGPGGVIKIKKVLRELLKQKKEGEVVTVEELEEALLEKQDTLVSGENVKTVGGQSIVGKGNIEVGDKDAIKFVLQQLTEAQKAQARANIDAYKKPSTGIPASDIANGVIPDITGKQDTITDLQEIRSGAAAGATAVQPSALSAKQDVLVSGTNIKTINNESILGSGNITIQGGGGSDPNAVKYTEQTLTNSQKAQARENIGACSASSASGTVEPSGDSSVKYTEQNLTSEQKAQARQNIGAGTSSFSGSFNDLRDKPQQVTLSQNIVADKSATGKAYSCKATYDDVHPAMAYAQPVGGMLPNVFYDLGVLDGGNVTFSLAAPLDASVLNHYFFVFRTGETVPNVTWPSNIVGWINGGDPELEPMTHYEISIINGYAAFLYI